MRMVLISGTSSMMREEIAHIVCCSALENCSAITTRVTWRTLANTASKSTSVVLYSHHAETSVDMIRSVVSGNVVCLHLGYPTNAEPDDLRTVSSFRPETIVKSSSTA